MWAKKQNKEEKFGKVNKQTGRTSKFKKGKNKDCNKNQNEQFIETESTKSK